MKTWHFEMAIVAAALTLTLAITGAPLLEFVGAAAVLASFGHASVSERLAAQEAARAAPTVACHRWALRYWVAKEICWVVYFVAHRSYAALVGCGVFLVYPLWRRWWRARGVR